MQGRTPSSGREYKFATSSAEGFLIVGTLREARSAAIARSNAVFVVCFLCSVAETSLSCWSEAHENAA